MLIYRFIARLYREIGLITWKALAGLTLLHVASTWALFAIVGDPVASLHPVAFLYFYETTATTIGFGDMSPATLGGMAVAIAWFYPGALLSTGAILTKLHSALFTLWRKRMDGHADYSHLEAATILIGYDTARTRRMVEEIRAGAGTETDIVLVAPGNQHVDTSRIHFVRAEHVSDRADLLRAGIGSAGKIVVYCDDDDATFTAAMAAAALNGSAHLVAYFEEEEKADLLRAHTTAVCIVNQAAEQLVREMQDPGVASLFTDLSSARTNVTPFAIEPGLPDLDAGTAFAAFRRLGATFLGAKCDAGDRLQFNLPDEACLGKRPLYYLAEARIDPADFAREVAGGAEARVTPPAPSGR